MAYGDDIFQRQMEARKLYGTGLGDLAPYINKSSDIMAQGFAEAQKQPLATAQLEAEMYGKRYALDAEKQKSVVDQARWDADQVMKKDLFDLEKKKLAQQRELELLKIGIDRAKSEKDAKLDPVTVRAMQEVGSRADGLKRNLSKLNTLVDDYGTEEMFGPQAEQMDTLIYQIALDYAKIVDPQSVAREGEVAAAQKYMLPVKGWLKTERSARTMIADMEKDVDSRVSEKIGSTGIDTTGKYVGFGDRSQQAQQQPSKASPRSGQFSRADIQAEIQRRNLGAR